MTKKHDHDADVKEAIAAEADAQDGAPAFDPIADMEAKLAAAQADILYAQADIQNTRRRLEKEVQDARAYAATGFARDILSVSDNLERALAAIPPELHDDEKISGVVKGLEATSRELASVFERNGIKRIEAVGQPLDPNKHQAMMEQPSSEAEPGTILAEMAPGYMFRERLLRPAMVI
ncbi:MAG: nucleotide exchange factor GrpE, partial [Alphaproteobacteria bacterium]|nr:nucleotide exchange factor GrpE [Alphaproteobacteria bacterium]